MSHFIGLVFGDNIEDNLTPYDENIDVEPYLKYTKQQAIDRAKKDIASGHYIYGSAMSKEEVEAINTDEGYYQYALKMWGYTPDENGNLMSTYNPKSKWDWYTEGGRWNNYIPTTRDWNTNCCRVVDVDWDKFFEQSPSGPFCFVTESGEWHESARMGYWGMTADEKEEDIWKKEFEDYIKTLDPETRVTAIDFHI